MTYPQHAIRVAFLMAAVAALMAWELRHSEATQRDGLRAIRQAQQIQAGAWRQGLVDAVEHPLHPLGIVAIHPIVGGNGPIAWQRAAVALGFAGIVLLAIPAYLLALEVFGARSAWLGPFLLLLHPLFGQMVTNALSESTFLLPWTWGLWAVARFLREGRFGWLLAGMTLGVVAFLARPEGLLLPLALAGTLVLLPLSSSARVNWPRWRSALSLLVLGSVLLAGPYVMLEGTVGTRPAIARVLGLEPMVPAEAAERERPAPGGELAWGSYVAATRHLAVILQTVVPFPLLVLATLGLMATPQGSSRPRHSLFLGILLLLSGMGLVRLYATGGYAAPRHALIPGSILLLAAGHGLSVIAEKLSVPGSWVGIGRGRYSLGPAIWTVLVAVLALGPRWGRVSDAVPGPFNAYQDAAVWLRKNAAPGEKLLDMTDWALFFSERPGYDFARSHEAINDAALRWVVVRPPHLARDPGHARLLQALIGDRTPTVSIPAGGSTVTTQLLIYDRLGPAGALAGRPAAGENPLR